MNNQTSHFLNVKQCEVNVHTLLFSYIDCYFFNSKKLNCFGLRTLFHGGGESGRHHLLVVFCEIALASLTVVVAPLLTLYKLFWIHFTIPLPCLYCKEQPAIKQLWTILSRGKQNITLGLKTRKTHWIFFPFDKKREVKQS